MSENVQYHACSKESRVVWAFNIFGHHQSKNSKKEEAPHCYRRDAARYLRTYLIPKEASTLFNKTPFWKNAEGPFERSHFGITPTDSKVRTSFNIWQFCTSDSILILIGHRRTAHYQSTLLSLGNYLQSKAFIHVKVTSVSDVNDIIFASNIAFVNVKVTSCDDNRTTFKKLPTVRATIFVISKIFQKYFWKPHAFEFTFENQIDPELLQRGKVVKRLKACRFAV